MNPATEFLEVCDRRAAKVAIIEPGGRSITYEALRRQIEGFAADLRGRGVRVGDRVLLQVPNGIDLAVVLLAVMLAGGVPLLIEPGGGDEAYLAQVNRARPGFVVVATRLRWLNRVPFARSLLSRFGIHVPPLPPSRGCRRLSVDAWGIRRAADKSRGRCFSPVDRDANGDAILVPTGGSTDAPKLVRLSCRALAAYLESIAGLVGGRSVGRLLADTPPQAIYGLRLGLTVHVSTSRRSDRARRALELIRSGAVDAYFGSPHIWRQMMSLEGEGRRPLPESMKIVFLGSAPVTPDFVERLKAWVAPNTELRIVYGLTEAGPVCTVGAEDKLTFEGAGDLVGCPLDGVRVEVRHAEAPGGTGEVHVLSPSLFSGYVGQRPRADGEWLATGDLGAFIEIGGRRMLLLAGRKKDLIIRAGFNIYPLLYEPSLKRIRDDEGRRLLGDCALVGVWDARRSDEEVVLCVQPHPGRRLDVAELERHVVRICGAMAAPDRTLVIDTFPVKGRQNKVDKQVLRELCRSKLR